MKPRLVDKDAIAGTVFLEDALGPLRDWLSDDSVVEIVANGPGELFVEVMGESAMRRVETPAVTSDWIRHLSERVAGFSNQSVNSEHPLLSAALATGERFQGVLAAGDDEWRRLRDPQAGHQRAGARRLSPHGLLRARKGLGWRRIVRGRPRALRTFGCGTYRGFHPVRRAKSLFDLALWRHFVGQDDLSQRHFERSAESTSASSRSRTRARSNRCRRIFCRSSPPRVIRGRRG